MRPGGHAPKYRRVQSIGPRRRQPPARRSPLRSRLHVDPINSSSCYPQTRAPAAVCEVRLAWLLEDWREPTHATGRERADHIYAHCTANHRLLAIRCRETGRWVLRDNFNARESRYTCNEPVGDAGKCEDERLICRCSESYRPKSRTVVPRVLPHAISASGLCGQPTPQPRAVDWRSRRAVKPNSPRESATKIGKSVRGESGRRR
jgi:hypothetical protein